MNNGTTQKSISASSRIGEPRLRRSEKKRFGRPKSEETGKMVCEEERRSASDGEKASKSAKWPRERTASTPGDQYHICVTRTFCDPQRGPRRRPKSERYSEDRESAAVCSRSTRAITESCANHARQSECTSQTAQCLRRRSPRCHMSKGDCDRRPSRRRRRREENRRQWQRQRREQVK